MSSYLDQLLEKLRIDSDNLPFKNRIREQDAYLLLHSPLLGTFYNSVISYEKGLLGECHAVTAYLCLSNPTWKYCFGLAEHGECLTEWSIHSWCLNEEKQLVEPTPREYAKHLQTYYKEKITKLEEENSELRSKLNELENSGKSHSDLGIELTDDELEEWLEKQK